MRAADLLNAADDGSRTRAAGVQAREIAVRARETRVRARENASVCAEVRPPVIVLALILVVGAVFPPLDLMLHHESRGALAHS